MKAFRFALAMIALLVSTLIIYPFRNCPQAPESTHTASLQNPLKVEKTPRKISLDATVPSGSASIAEGEGSGGNDRQADIPSKCKSRPVKNALESIKSDRMVKGDFFQNGVFGSSGEALEIMGTPEAAPCCDG